MRQKYEMKPKERFRANAMFPIVIKRQEEKANRNIKKIRNQDKYTMEDLGDSNSEVSSPNDQMDIGPDVDDTEYMAHSPQHGGHNRYQKSGHCARNKSCNSKRFRLKLTRKYSRKWHSRKRKQKSSRQGKRMRKST